MNTKIVAALFAATAAVAVPAIAANLTIEPLNATTGYVTSVDMTKGTVVVNGKTYAAKPADLNGVQPGVEIELWFDNKAQAAIIEIKPANQPQLLS